jgi:hypothetical protein
VFVPQCRRSAWQLRHALGQAFFSFFAFLVLDGLSNIERENGYRIGCVSQNIKENDLKEKKNCSGSMPHPKSDPRFVR